MSLAGRIDHMRKLSNQSGAEVDLLIYSASGSQLSASRMKRNRSIIEHGAYWTALRSPEEGVFLAAILNSNAVVAKIRDLQVIGEAGTRRHLDNLVWTLPIPEYDASEPLHRDLAAAGLRAETVAAAVELTESHFTAKRRAIRAALAEDGIAAEIEALVDALLPP
jgi:hypothetical protein